MSRKDKVKIFKIILMILVVIIFIGVIIYLFPVMKDLSTKEGQIAFRDKVESSGLWGMLSLFGLQVANIFLIVVPGEPIEIIAGMCYGAFGNNICNGFSLYNHNRNILSSKKIRKKIRIRFL